MNRIFLGLGIGAVSIALAGVVQEGAIAYMVAKLRPNPVNQTKNGNKT
jgi:hypothetical protein